MLHIESLGPEDVLSDSPRRREHLIKKQRTGSAHTCGLEMHDFCSGDLWTVTREREKCVMDFNFGQGRHLALQKLLGRHLLEL